MQQPPPKPADAAAAESGDDPASAARVAVPQPEGVSASEPLEPDAEYWTEERMASAEPREIRLDANGKLASE